MYFKQPMYKSHFLIDNIVSLLCSRKLYLLQNIMYNEGGRFYFYQECSKK